MPLIPLPKIVPSMINSNVMSGAFSDILESANTDLSESDDSKVRFCKCEPLGFICKVCGPILRTSASTQILPLNRTRNFLLQVGNCKTQRLFKFQIKVDMQNLLEIKVEILFLTKQAHRPSH